MKKQYKNLILKQTYIIIFLIICYIFLKSKYIYLIPICSIREKFGILCPACSGTKFALEMARFNFVKAFNIHPVFFILVIYLILIDIIYIINVLFKKNIKIFRLWHIIVWVTLLIVYTILRNII